MKVKLRILPLYPLRKPLKISIALLHDLCDNYKKDIAQDNGAQYFSQHLLYTTD